MANPNTGSLYADAADGSVSKSGAVWATQRAAATGDSRDKTSATVNATQVQEFTGTYYIDRGFLTFDTSSIPDGAVVTAATLYIYANSKAASGISDSLCIVESTQASATDLTTADFDAVGTTELATRVAHSSISTSAYTSFALNSSGLAVISKTGYSKFALRSARDLDNSAPGTGQYAILNINCSEATGTSKDPYLVVEYSTDRTTSDSWAWSDTAVQSNTKFASDSWAWSDAVETYSRSQTNVVVKDPGTYTLLNGAQDLSSATITVDSTASFASSGSFHVAWSASSSRVTYTGKTATTFTGCTETHTNRSGNAPDNAIVSLGDVENSFPQIVPLDSTDYPVLLASYQCKASHNALSGSMRFKTSSDGGQSWGSETTIVAAPVLGHGYGIYGTTMARLKNGRLIAMWYEHDLSGTNVFSYLSYSDDTGSSWSTPSQVTSPFHADYCAVGFNTYLDTGVGANATYGDLYVTAYGTDDGNDSAGDDHYSRLQKITDGGSSGDWTDVSTIATMAQTAYDGYAKANGEAAIDVLQSGRWVCQLRVETHIGTGTDTTYPSRYSCYSDDAGATWTGHTLSLADVSNACTAHVMPEGWVLSQGRPSAVGGMRTWISPDGVTWDAGNYRQETDDSTYTAFVGSSFVNVRDTYDFPNVVNAWAMETSSQDFAKTYFTWFQGPPYSFDTWLWTDSTPTLLNRTTSDSWAWSDAAARAASFARISYAYFLGGRPEELWQWSDGVVAGGARLTSDSWAWSDAAGLGGSVFPRTTSDSWAWSDSAARAASFTRISYAYFLGGRPEELWQWSDSAARLLLPGPGSPWTSDSWAWSDAAGRSVLVFQRVASDPWAWSDAVVPTGAGITNTIVLHPMIPAGAAIGAYRRWEWRGPVAAKLNAGPGAVVQATSVADDLTVTFVGLDPGEYVAYAPEHPTRRLFFMVTE